MKQLKDLSLRERKYAQTKVNLLKATVAKLDEKRLDEISVRELCDEVFISEATFFNYFPQKSDLLVYYIKLWSLEMQWHIMKEGLSGFEAIEKIFTTTSDEKVLIGNYGMMDEINGYFALNKVELHDSKMVISLAEKLTAFPELEGIDEIEEMGFAEVVEENLIKAMEIGELPPGIDVELGIHSIISSFFGLRMTSRLKDPDSLTYLYKGNLKLIWAGLIEIYK